MRIYAIYDRKLGLYQPVLQAETTAVGVLRAIADGVKQAKGSLMNLHPHDFDVMCLGELDQVGGVISAYPTPRLIENVGALVQAAELEEGRPPLRAEA